mgnify:CR=1 FL=1
MIDSNGCLRCDQCGKLVLLHIELIEANLEFYCPRCHFYQKIQASTSQVKEFDLTSKSKDVNIIN